ncbi:MAG TPA: triose-phosphate isomerase [Verrucomicrobiae bacterium]|nr:triose-phosphate isomerase [Verrucomicrobiae bacterium]
MNSNRKPIIAGNWKMYNTAAASLALVNALKKELVGVNASDVETVVCPPFTALYAVSTILQDSAIALGAQNVHWEKEGAFTGEVAAPMLKELSVRYAIVGHSERRQFFGETNEGVNKRAKAALANGIRPIVCGGETLAQREAGQTEAVVRDHVTAGLAGFTKDGILETVIAYEPVWAIGTGKTATPAQAQEVHAFIRELLAAMFDQQVASKVRIQYGGSVKPANAKELLGQPDIDGALVGGASLKAADFAAIVKAAV